MTAYYVSARNTSMNSNALSAEYLAAIAAHDAAQAEYQTAVTAYRAGKIGDAEYLKARDALKVADAAFDVAFAAEAARGNDAE